MRQPKADGDLSINQQTIRPVETYRRLAQQYETNQQPSKALFMWRVVDSLNPGDATAKERITQLRQTIQTQGAKHLDKGREYLEQKSFRAAREEFVLALAYNPGIKEAADHLRMLSVADEFVEYEVQAGDNPERIAQTVYRDGGKHFIVAYFADVTHDRDLRQGRIIRLPAPEQEIKTKAVPSSRPYSASNEVPKPYDKAGAEAHYNKGVANYLAQEFREAIKEWEETLRLDPGHPHAKRDLRKARAMLRKTRSK
jgi:tetratricopeptide (TPR) repeat protein